MSKDVARKVLVDEFAAIEKKKASFDNWVASPSAVAAILSLGEIRNPDDADLLVKCIGFTSNIGIRAGSGMRVIPAGSYQPAIKALVMIGVPALGSILNAMIEENVADNRLLNLQYALLAICGPVEGPKWIDWRIANASDQKLKTRLIRIKERLLEIKYVPGFAGKYQLFSRDVVRKQ